MNYSKVTLLYQRNILQRARKIPSRYTVKAGGYLGFLKNEFRYYNNNIVLLNDSYTNIDYGVKLAIGQEKDINSFIVGYGINSEYGLRNIFVGNKRFPAALNQTHTFNVGGYINLKYRF